MEFITPRVLAALAALAAATLGGAGLADAAPRKAARPAALADIAGTPPPGFASWAALAAVQTRLTAAATALRAATAHRPGYAGIALAVDQRRIDLYWQGSVPAAVRQRVGAATRVRAARYSAAQLAAAAKQVLRTRTVGGARVVRVGAAPDASALEVSVTGGATAARSAAPATVAGVALRVTGGTAADPAYSRLDDTPAYWGGSRVHNATRGGRCTGGFGVRDRSLGITGVLFAAHCGESGDRFTTPTGRTVGNAVAKYRYQDTMVIPASAGGRIYVGDPAAATSFPVVGAGYSFPGQWICTSGSFSGTRCAIRVERTGEYVNITGIGVVGPLVRAEQWYRQNAVGQGDSGGPAFADEGGRARALGTNTAIDGNTAVACTGEGNRICAWRMWYADVMNALVRHNSTIITG
ncbi:hypothetical protein GCM10010123_26360 [Pilimelia anulata]|uniref:Uncharacterized protein n=1 Tax=Pilimelia anulata TaxID=53371 RepID=A0A8J3F908_9ACTN|nr:hypothetical protein [Pilimelia anulata]GGJ95298.1 hypothetical protein GCM10010123_26360 [Pilimelia anulata]